MPHNLWVSTLWIYGLLAAALVLSNTPLAPYLLPLQVFAAAAIMLYLSGAHLMAVLEQKARQPFEPWTFTALSVLYSLFFPPVLLFILYTQFGHIHQALAFAVYATPPALHAAAQLLNRSRQPHRYRIAIRSAIKHPATAAVVIILLVHAVTLSRFSFLPAPDVYSWLIKYEGAFSQQKLLTDPNPHRQAHVAFVAALHYFTTLPLFTLFKYILPQLALLTVIPTWLIARRVRPRLLQFSILLFPLAIPALTLEFDITRQQTFFLLYLFFAAGLLFDAAQSKNKLQIALVAVPAAAGYFVHPAFRFFIIIWLVAAVGMALPRLRQHKARTVFLLLLLFFLLPRQPLWQMYEQGRAVLSNALRGNWNLRFPAYYINSDGYEMSWPGFIGVAKYYAYYAGPVMLASLAAAVLCLIRLPQSRSRLARASRVPALLPLVLAAVLFFIIAEIAPRFGRISYLPERAWQFFSIIALPLFIPLLQQTAKPRLVAAGIFSLTAISIGGSIYIAHLTKYTIPPYELQAADWMRSHLPANAQVFSSSSRNVIRYHADAGYVGFPAEYYYEENPSNILDRLAANLTIGKPAGQAAKSIADQWEAILRQVNKVQADGTRRIQSGDISREYFTVLESQTRGLQNNLTTIHDLLAQARQEFQETDYVTTHEPAYIYYAATHTANPYIGRPYEASFTGSRNVKEFPALDGTPQHFRLVYADNDRVRIWQVFFTPPP